MKSQVTQMLNESAQKANNNHPVSLNWLNFRSVMEVGKGLGLKWPAHIPRASTQKMSKDELEELLHGLRDGSIGFYKLSKEERLAAKEALAKESEANPERAAGKGKGRKKVAEASLQNLRKGANQKGESGSLQASLLTNDVGSASGTQTPRTPFAANPLATGPDSGFDSSWIFETGTHSTGSPTDQSPVSASPVPRFYLAASNATNITTDNAYLPDLDFGFEQPPAQQPIWDVHSDVNTATYQVEIGDISFLGQSSGGSEFQPQGEIGFDFGMPAAGLSGLEDVGYAMDYNF